MEANRRMDLKTTVLRQTLQQDGSVKSPIWQRLLSHLPNPDEIVFYWYPSPKCNITFENSSKRIIFYYLRIPDDCFISFATSAIIGSASEMF